MQCACGGVMIEAKSVRTAKGAALEFQRCTSCGRQDFYRLFLAGELEAQGQDARRRYLDIEAGPP